MTCKTSKLKKTIFWSEKTDKSTLMEKGRLQYFYHSPSSKLPIRDVLNEQNMGEKKEPHIEVGAENYWAECYQRKNIIPFAESDGKYLFLMTTCRNSELAECYGTKLIVGYIVKDVVGMHQGRCFIKGDTFLYSFEDSIPIEKMGYSKFTRVKLIGKRDTSRILQHFRNKTNILDECIDEIKRIDKNNITCQGKRGYNCPLREDCLRWK